MAHLKTILVILAMFGFILACVTHEHTAIKLIAITSLIGSVSFLYYCLYKFFNTK